MSDSDDVKVDSVRLEIFRTIGEGVELLRPTIVAVVGDLLVVSDPGADTVLVLFDRRSGRLVRRLGRRGQGPGEFIDPRWITPSESADGTFWVYDFQLRRLSLIDPARSARAEYVRALNMNNGVSLMGTVVSGPRIWANGLFDDVSMVVLDTSGHIERRLDLGIPFDSSDMPARVGRRQLNRTFMAQDPTGARLALLYQWVNRADFLDTRDGRSVRSKGPRETRVEYYLKDNRFFIRDTVSEMAYVGAAANASAVYGLHCGCASFNSARLSLHEWNWDGALRRVHLFDMRPSALAVSERDELYLLLDDPEPHIVAVRPRRR